MAGDNPLSEVTGDSPSFGFLEYYLRLSLHASTAKIVQAWEISNPQLNLQFERRAKDLLTMDAWIDVSKLPEHNCEDDAVRRGFQFNASGEGIKFNVGKMKIEEEGHQDHHEKGIIRKRMLLCKIAVGRAYNASNDFARIAAIPDGYDSFVLDHEQISLSGTSMSEGAEMNFEYILKDSSQILPTFVVVFEYNREAELRSRSQSMCENCENAVATVFCSAETANLCDSCDATLHNTKLTSRHIRNRLDAGPHTFSACRQHPDKIVEFFCPTCSRPVCVHCKMVGHHSTGEAARHKLITVAEAFIGVSEAANASDPLLEHRKQKISQQLVAVGERVKAIEVNTAEVQSQLEEIYNKALNDLKNLTKKKLNILKGDLTELYRQSAEIGHLEEFLAYQRGSGNATQFILDWAHHQRLRGELHSFGHFRETIDVLPDIRINGAIQVHVDAINSDERVNRFGVGGGGSGINRMRMHQSGINPSVMDFSSLTKTRKPTRDYSESIMGGSILATKS